jgi:predicted transcriptional regulator
MTALTLRLPDDLHEELRREAFNKRTTITALILEALRNRNTNQKEQD